MADQNRNITYSVIHLALTIVENHKKRIVTFQKLDRLIKKIHTRERPETYDSVGQSCKAFEIGNVLWNRLEAGKAFASLDSHFIGYIYLLLPISKRVNLFKKNSLHLIKYFKANRNYVPPWNFTNNLHDHMFMPSSRNWLPQLPW